MSRYQINQIEYPSVTEVLGMLDKSPALMGWAVKCCVNYIAENFEIYGQDRIGELLAAAKTNYKDISQDSLDIGSEVHSSIEAYIKFGKDKIGTIRDEVSNALIAFWDWEKANNVKWLETEMPVVNEAVGYAGTLDAIAEVNGVITCIDFKSSKAIYEEYITQVCAYKFARESMSGEYIIKGRETEWTKGYEPVKIVNVGILRLDKETGMPEWKLIDNPDKIEREYKAFQALINYFYLAKKRRLKGNPRAI